MNDPANPLISKFSFDSELAATFEKDLDLRIEALNLRIEKLVRKVQLSDHPILGMILAISHDKDDLLTVSRALERVATLVSDFDELQKRKMVFETARKDPGWFAAVFGDATSASFTKLHSELDEFISKDDNQE